MSPDRYFNPGTEWEGEIVPMSKKDVLYVPTGALIRHEGSVYLPVRVSTGITTEGLTQITAGIEERRELLVLDDEQLRGSARHKQETDLDALKRRARAQRGEDEPAGSELGPVPMQKKKGKHAAVIEDDTDYGEDPYAEPQ